MQQINNNTLTVKQRQAYDDLQKSLANHISALVTLGPKNDSVDKQFSDILNNIDNLNSGQIQSLINKYEDLGKKANLTADEQAKFNDELGKLKDLLKETQLKEESKKYEDFFGAFAQAGTAAGAIGTFVIQLAKMKGGLEALGKVLKAAPEIGAILTLLLGGQDVKTAGGGEANQPKNANDLFKNLPFDQTSGGFEDFLKRLGPPGNATSSTINAPKLEIKIDNLNMSRDMDIDIWAKKVMEYWKENNGQGKK